MFNITDAIFRLCTWLVDKYLSMMLPATTLLRQMAHLCAICFQQITNSRFAMAGLWPTTEAVDQNC